MDAKVDKKRTILVSLVALLDESSVQLRPLENRVREHAQWSERLAVPIDAPKSYRRRDWSVAGRAFDYWLRALLAVKHGIPSDFTVIDLLLADGDADWLSSSMTVVSDEGADVEMSVAAALAECSRTRKNAIAARELGSVSFFENCIMHGQMEAVYRRGGMDELSCAPEVMVADLRQMARRAYERHALFECTNVDLNPRFSHPVFAADGDFAMDRQLVDIKTTKEIAPPLAFTQALCYSIIEAWPRGSNSAALKYDKIAVYSARFAALGVVVVAEVEQIIAELRSFLSEAALKHESRRSA